MGILECGDARPVAIEVREQLLEPFIAAASVTLLELAQIELVVRSVYQTARPRTLADLSAALGITTEAGDVLVLSFPMRTATALAGRILAEVTDSPDDDLVRDCMGEICNVVAGQAKTMLAETPYQLLLATPSVLSGAGLEFGARPDAEGLVVVFASDAGDFALQLCLEQPGPHAASAAKNREGPQ